jgi:hypothetical protein
MSVLQTVSDLGAGESSGPQVVPVGNYDVTELQENGWDLADAYCYGGDGFQGSFIDAEDTMSNVSVGNGQNVQCYFINHTTNGWIQIKKVTNVETPTIFDFNIDDQGNDAVDDDVHVGAGQTSDPVVVPAGAYDVSELVPEGWSMGVASCVDVTPRQQQEITSLGVIGEVIETGSQDGDTVFGVQVPGGHTILCTFNDSKKEGGETPQRDVCNNIAGNQESPPSGMTQNASGGCDLPPPLDACPNLDGTQDGVPVGMVVDDQGICVEEPPPPTDVCPNVDGDQATVPDGMVTDEQGDCQPAATITIVNEIDETSDQSQTFTFSIQHDQSALAAFFAAPNLDTDGSAELGQGQSDTAHGLVPGDYTLTEDARDGWDAPSIDCGDAVVSVGGSFVQVHLKAGQNVTCVFNNHESDKVLGEVIHKPVPSAARPARSGVLPFTGEALLPFLYLGSMLILTGGCLIVRRTRGRHLV